MYMIEETGVLVETVSVTIPTLSTPVVLFPENFYRYGTRTLGQLYTGIHHFP